ncbi:helix-turn-helix domain-containing protein [Veillonella ratti]|uniref:helix-turn-helix domain-containing protein n=1 Tax=Veillonella ratti TaxID=103892 RepID=UPI000F8CBD30|nr:helix-turn-helix transcriptional regulator [Veillonella ratti]
MYKKFEKLLKTYKVTAYRVGKETGIPTATFTAWKQGKYTPKADKLLKIAEYFNVPIEYFLG